MRCYPVRPHHYRVEGSDDWPVDRANSSNRSVQVLLGVVIPTLVPVIESFLFVVVVLVMFPMVVLLMAMFPMGLC